MRRLCLLITREKALPPQTPFVHNGPLTRARQIPNNLSGSAAASSTAPGGDDSASTPTAVRHSERVLPSGVSGGDSMALVEESELEALEFQAVRSRAANAHVVPIHCGEALCLLWNPNLFCVYIWELFWGFLFVICFLFACCSANL